VVTISVFVSLVVWPGCGDVVPHRNEGPEVQAGSTAVVVTNESPLTTFYVDTTPACPLCEIRLTTIGQFGSRHDTILLRGLPVVVIDSRGRFYAAVPGASDHELIAFDSTGSVLGAIGGYGEGPGEFRVIWDLLVGRGDSLYVLHDNRVSVFGPLGELARSVSFDPPIASGASFVGIRDGRFLLTEDYRPGGADSLGLPLHEYDEQGAYVRAFGPRGLMGDYSWKHGMGFGKRRATLVRDGAVWLKDDPGYWLEKVGERGETLRVIGVNPPARWGMRMASARTIQHLEDSLGTDPWSRASRNRAVRNRTEPLPTVRRATRQPATFPIDIGLLDPGPLLIVVLHTAAADWRAASVRLDTTRLTEEGFPTDAVPGYSQRLHDSIIDIIDPSTGQVIARTRVPGTLHVSGDRLLYRINVTEHGIVGAEMFTLKLYRPASQ
jgi:hypothetical protein